MANVLTDMSTPQGTDKDLWYKAVVVNNNDPDMWGRIQARPLGLMDEVLDPDLPWAIPIGWDHCDGSDANSGVVSIPKNGTFVHLKFEKGSPKHPHWKGYHGDSTTILEEAKMNYPDRAVARFRNKTLLVIDTKDNIIYFRSPGDMRVCIVGDYQREVFGNVTEIIHGNVQRTVMGTTNEIQIGNYNKQFIGNKTETILGKFHLRVVGEMLESFMGRCVRFVSGKFSLRSGSLIALDAPMIYENSGQADSDPSGPQTPPETELKDWPGIRGGAHG